MIKGQIYNYICELNLGRGSSPKTASPWTLRAKALILAAMSTFPGSCDCNKEKLKSKISKTVYLWQQKIC